YTVPVDQWSAIQECNKTFSHSRSGMNIRSEHNWRGRLPADSHLRIYAVGTPIEAYCIVKHKVDFWVPQEIEEFVWTTQRSYEAMLMFFRQLGINKSKIKWTEPSDSPYHAKYWDYSSEATMKRPTMYRVLDVPAALRLLQTTESGSFSIKVSDPDISENNGPWLVTFSADGVTVEPTDSADLEADIQQFTQGFMGEPSFAQLATNGLIKVNNENGLKAACALMPHSPTMCLEFF
ncbi:MAG TPA: sterol carrier protein domain-containing protein, partial [Fimbriimonas sp.]|nr:sterol carrier protein domain-containing protein [Fimbriimonas sp.]